MLMLVRSLDDRNLLTIYSQPEPENVVGRVLVSHGFLGWKQVSSFLSARFIHAVRFYSSSGAMEKCFSMNKCPFKDQGYCLGMNKSLSEQYLGGTKSRIKNIFFDWIRGLAELFLQTHHFPSLPLLPGVNLIISSLLLLHFNKQSLFSSVHFSPFFPCYSSHLVFITKQSLLFSTVLVNSFLVPSF